jgi:hypothetical protein
VLHLNDSQILIFQDNYDKCTVENSNAVPVLNTSGKMYGGSEGTVSQILELRAGQKLTLSFTSDHMTGENLTDTLWEGSEEPHTRSELVEERKSLCPAIIEPGFLGRLIYSPVTLPAKLSSWVLNCN